MGIKGSRNVKKVTGDTILEAYSNWMNSMNWRVKVGSMFFTIKHFDGVFFVYNDNDDLLRKFSVTTPLEVEINDINRHIWTKDLSCSKCGVGLFDVDSSYEECSPRLNAKREISWNPEDILGLPKLADIGSADEGSAEFLGAIKDKLKKS